MNINDPSTAIPNYNFRNYVPRNEKIRSGVVKFPSVPSREAEALLTEAKRKARLPISDDKQILLAPKRANWDLKRDIEKKLRKLSKRTQIAIAELATELNSQSEETTGEL